MKRFLLISSTILLSLSILGCGIKKDSSEDEFEDSIIEKVEVSNNDDSVGVNYEDERAAFDDSVPDDLPEPNMGEDFVEKGAVVIGLEKIEHMEDPMLFKNDMDIYLEYCFPDIDKLYNVYVIEGSEQEASTGWWFKVRVEGIMEDGSDLEVTCTWTSPVFGHFNFKSELTPKGTQYRVDANGNPIVYEH